MSAELNRLLDKAVSGERDLYEEGVIGAEHTRFGLNDEQWAKFVAVLDSPPKELPRLKKLLQEPGVFDGQR